MGGSEFCRPPTRGEYGNTGKTAFRLSRHSQLGHDAVQEHPVGRGENAPRLQFRWEAYNVFNHTQYMSVDTTARFNPAGQQINATFGQVTATRPPRQMQGSLRIQF